MDPYDVLGVRADATPEEVRRAYVELARHHHPDHHLDSSPATRLAAEQRMREINEAWATLRDPERRRRHDDEQPRPFRPFSNVEEEIDPREAPDVPYRARPESRRDRIGTMAPVLLFAGSVLVGILGMTLRAAALLGFAGVLFLLSCVGFLVVPLMALGRARQDEG